MLTVTLIVALPNPNRTCQSVHGVWCENWTAVQTHYLHAVSSERRRAVWQEKIIGNNFDRLWMDISMAGGRATNACIVLCVHHTTVCIYMQAAELCWCLMIHLMWSISVRPATSLSCMSQRQSSWLTAHTDAGLSDWGRYNNCNSVPLCWLYKFCLVDYIIIL